MKTLTLMASLAAVSMLIACAPYEEAQDQGNGPAAAASASAPAFEALANDGKTYSLKGLTEKGPVFILFLKHHCSADPFASPLYNQVINAYGNKANFVAVINAGKNEADEHAKTYSLKFPVILDPEKKIIKAYGVKRSQQVIMVDTKGNMSPMGGFGRDALSKLNASVAESLKVPVANVDLSNAPARTAFG